MERFYRIRRKSDGLFLDECGEWGLKTDAKRFPGAISAYSRISVMRKGFDAEVVEYEVREVGVAK